MCNKVNKFIEEALKHKVAWYVEASEFSARDVFEWYQCMKQKGLLLWAPNFNLLLDFMRKNPGAKVRVGVLYKYTIVIKFSDKELVVKRKEPFKPNKTVLEKAKGLKGVFSTDKGGVNLPPVAAIQHILSFLRRGERITVFWSLKSGEKPRLIRTISSIEDLKEFLNDIRKYLKSLHEQ